jgi:leucyl-tRNA synthetase
LADAGLIDFREPFRKLRSQGILHAADGKRMSKSRGNVVTPDEVVNRYGADILRIHLLFMAPFDRNVNWDEEGIAGAERFLQRVWRLCQWGSPPEYENVNQKAECVLCRATHRTIQRMTADIETFKFNTAIAALMEFVNSLGTHREQYGPTPEFRKAACQLILLLAPFAPHISEELWASQGHATSVHRQAWPAYDPDLLVAKTISLVIQVNGKVRDRILVPADISEADARMRALESERVQQHLHGQQPNRAIVVPGKLINLVV